jgi:predicted GNAT family acetyltransferase
MANENTVPANFSASAPLVSPAPEPSGNPVGNPQLDAVISRATGQPKPIDTSVPLVPPSAPFNPSPEPITLPEGTEYVEDQGPVTLPEGTEYHEAPKNLKEAHSLGQAFNPITDFDAAGLAEAAKQKAFNPVDLFMQSPLAVQNDSAVRNKVADAFMQVWQYSEKHPLEGISVGSVATAIGHLGKGILDWAKNHIDVITSAAGGDTTDARTKAAENILELQMAGTQLGYQGEDLAKWVARRVFKENIVKPLSAYSPEEKDKALQDEIDRRRLTQRILSGKTLERVEKEGLKINPEKIASMAGADPLQFLAFEGAGAAAKTGLKLVPELAEAGPMAAAYLSKMAPKAIGALIKGGGKLAEVSAKPVGEATKLAETTGGKYLAAHLLGPTGVLIAEGIGKAGKYLPKVAEAGTNIGEQLTKGVTSNTAQAIKDVLEASPHALKSVLSGAAYDAAFSAAAKSPEEREGIGLGTALGLGGGLSRMAIHGIGGQLVGERLGAFTPRDVQLFHDTYNTGYEHHQFADNATAQARLEKLGLTPEQAKSFSQKRGGTFETPQGKFTYAIGADATPHEPVHAWKRSLPAEEQASLDKETRARYSDDEIQQLKDKYASQLDPENFNGKNSDEILNRASPGESADSYTINEIQAENLMTALKAGEGKGLLHKGAKISADVLSAVGVEPLATRPSQSGALQFPLKHEEVAGLKSALDASKPIGGAEAAKEKATSRNVEGLAEKFPDKAASIGALGEAQSRGTGVKLTYAAAPGEAPADSQSASPLSGRKSRAAAVEAARDLPTWARNPWWKTFFPDRTFASKKGKLQTGGWAPEIFQANAYRFAKEAAPHDEMRTLSPYEIDKSTGFYTPDAWNQLTADVQTAAKNWKDGRTASGTPIVVPEELSRQSKGQIYQPQVGPGGGPLDQGKADFISHLMGHQLPETPRLAKSFPLNVAGQDVSAATIPGRVVGPSRGEFGTHGNTPEEMVSQREHAKAMGVEGRQLLEVNPFRLKLDAATKAAGVKSPKPLSVYQKLNHERILRIEHAPGEPEFRGNTLTQAAGFEPMPAKTEVELTGPDGKKYRARFDGHQDFSSIGKGTVPQFTALEDLPGSVIKDSTTYGPSLEKAGYKLPETAAFEPAKVADLSERLKNLDDRADQVKAKQAASAFIATREGRAPNNEVRANAEDYMRITGREHKPHADNVPVNEALGKKVADWYEAAKHSPDNPAVKESYDALANETLDQYNHLVSKGVKFDAWKGEGQPYKDSAAMMRDVRDNKHLYYFPSDSGFGEGEKITHPMLEPVTLPDGTKVPVNDLFRAVHDYYGHAKEGYEFGPRGEYNAFLAHSRMYSEAAQPAMAAETMGQNSWTNFGPHLRNAEGNIPKKGEAGYIPPPERKFSEQKALAMPKDLLDSSTARFEPSTKAGQAAQDRGYDFEKTEAADGSRYSFRDKTGSEVAHVQIIPDSQNKKLAWVDDTVTATAHRRQGLAEALYREAATDLQKKGITLLGGLTMNDAPRRLREKVFGSPLSDKPAVPVYTGQDLRNTFSAIRPEAQFEPASAAGSGGGPEVKKAQKAWLEKGVKSPYFKKWFKGSAVVDEDGNPKIVYHGTTHEFDQFKMDRANPENSFGRGYYFTDDANDASGNYEGFGPDLEIRVENRTEEIMSDSKLGLDRARQKAMDELVGNSDRTIEAYLKMENPAVVKKNGGTQFEYQFNEDTGEETGSAIDLFQSIQKVAPEFGVDADKLWGKLTENGSEFSAYDLHDALNVGEFYPSDPETNQPANGELVKEIFKDLGHDGIILHNAKEEYPGMNIKEGTIHYIAFDPAQIKSVENRGTFSKTDPRYNFEPVKFNTKEIAKDIWDKVKKTGGGFTYNPYSRQFMTTGYAVSIYPEKEISRVIDPKDFTLGELENFIEDRKHLLTRAENSVGGWLDPESGKLYLDVAFTTPSRPLAEYAGQQFNQKAVGDLAKYAAGENGDIATGGTGEPIEDMTPAHQRVDELLKDYAWEQPAGESKSVQELMPGIGTRAPLTSKDIGEMTKAELLRHYPESVVPKRRKDLIDYNIKNAPRWKGKENATDIAAAELEKFSQARLNTPEFQDGLKWYSQFVPMLKSAYGKNHEMMAQLLAATSPRNSPAPNFAMANDALEGYKAGRFDKQIKKYLDGVKMLESGTWKSWYEKQRKADKLSKPRDNPSNASFMAEWIEAHNLAPRQSNGKLYGMHSVPVLQVMAGKWLTENTGPKTLQFVKNLLGVHHGATVDIWAARTMRRLGHEGISERWRILPGNETSVNDADFAFSQEAFEKAASRIGVEPDALQGALWFAEKKLWAERGWGRLDLGDFRKEIAKREMLNQGIKKRLTESGTQATQQGSLLDLITPRNER